MNFIMSALAGRIFS